MDTIKQNTEQFKKLKDNPKDSPFVMLNLLKFKEPDGREFYLQYVKESDRFVKSVGAKVVFLGKPAELVYGSEDWDMMMLVQYPSRKAFLEMANNPDYIVTHTYREKAVERAVLYAIDEMSFKDILSS